MVIAEAINGQSKQASKKLEEKLSPGQEWSETDKLLDEEYELIKKYLWVPSELNGGRSLVDGQCSFEELVCIWLAHTTNLNENQKKLNKELLKTLKGIGSYLHEYDTKKLENFLKNNKDDQDLKVVLNLKRGESGLTLLHAASRLNDDQSGPTLVNLLLQAGADPNIESNEGKTPLHYAADSNYRYLTINLLLEGKADPNIRDNKRKTPLQTAIDNNNCHILECFLTDNQKKLSKELYDILLGILSPEDYKKPHVIGEVFNRQAIENLGKFLDKHKNSQDLKMIFIVQDRVGMSKVLSYARATCKEAVDLLLKAGATDPKKDANMCNKKKKCLLPPRTLWSIPNQQIVLGGFLNDISQVESMDQLEKVVDRAIDFGVMLNFAKKSSQGEKYNFTDYVIKEISRLEKNPKVASDIVCKLVSWGAACYTKNSIDVIGELELEFKDHKANMIKAHEKYVNCTQKFLKIAKNATNGKLNRAKMDNATFYLEYSEDSTIDVAQITDGTRDLGLTHGDVKCGRNIVKIGNSEVEIITKDGVRNYTDLTEGGDIVFTFYTIQGELEVRLYPDTQNKDLIRVEVNDQDLLEELKNCNEKIGKNCLLGGLPVDQAIERGFFTRSGKLCQYSETVSSAAQTVNEKQQLLQDLRYIESNIVKKEKNFDIKTHLVEIFKTLSRFCEEKGDISKTDLAKAAEKESKKLGLEGKYNWSKIFGLEKGVIEKAEKQGDKEQKSNIPDNFYLGQAIEDGNCFFDSFRQELEQQLGIKATVEQLRQYCKEFARNNPPEWFINAITNSHDNNGVVRRETPDFYAKNILNNNRWGDPEVEGRILCGKYGVKLHVVESNPLHATDEQQDPSLHQLIDSLGSRSTGEYNRIDYDDNNVLHIVNKGHDHFEPLFNSNKILAKCYSSLPRCSMDELKIESHQHKSLLVSGS
ncbi:ankyrin repeat domain-containing protein [Wolbachia endosymbiont (group A) of Protocalliphora azurea]|uniref:ankyrin repeat domain-containing protein n=1 Tax=Wolbachia endosymbiont (group A) of Protocalliphora azurea TaxID=2954050 RepID=UPI0022309488|nr:ankyrin repeat domain-containing protein [Wolbachia endosymbiont (group A) of Protocalliphora azurea]